MEFASLYLNEFPNSDKTKIELLGLNVQEVYILFGKNLALPMILLQPSQLLSMMVVALCFGDFLLHEVLAILSRQML